MRIAIEGCAHGELDNIYAAIKEVEEKENIKIDLLICCGDFQSSRNDDDLSCMAVPPKYRHICSFHKYYSGQSKAPVLTIFIGGNHEASNYLQELPYGGWVAPNIYYLGYAGVINIAGLRIGGISGIYKGRDFLKGRFEKPPYDENTKRSVYHIRNLEVFRLKQISEPMDIFLSHDWPSGVYNHGNVKQLLKRKPFFKDEIESNQLGSKPCEELLNHLKPGYWFSAHLHCKFAALVPHEKSPPTKFLALDKCLPRRQFLQIVEVAHVVNKKIQIEYDLEWLTVLFLTNHLLSVKNTTTYMPGPGGNERYDFTPSEEEKTLVLNKMHNCLKVPKNFRPTAVAYQAGVLTKQHKQPEAKLNPQTIEFCELLDVSDPICLISESNGLNLSLDSSFFENTTFVNDSECESASNTSVEEDIDTAEQESEIKELQLPELKMLTPMKLPQPKAEPELEDSESVNSKIITTEADNDLVETSKTALNHMLLDSIVECSQNSIEESSQVSSDKRSLSDEIVSVISEECGESDCNVSVAESDTKTPKKFKRRNISFYGTENIES